MRKKHTNVRKMWGDMGYQGKDLKDHIKREYDIEIEIVKRPRADFGCIKIHHQSYYQKWSQDLKCSEKVGCRKDFCLDK
ncbi:transposase, IS5 family, OrfB [Trichonephila clavata]|uniref:Transposase, IS5 family, OrfB n=1 Tax=Trichonephila clavata TaxID=2740835 RepID=A0A8X6KH98_TRICU|nr:transposase, IS5 family, OrfB [Trichonephila clavata]